MVIRLDGTPRPGAPPSGAPRSCERANPGAAPRACSGP